MTEDDKTDERLAAILTGEAASHHPEPDWDDVRRRAETSRRRLWQLPALAAALIIVALVAAALLADAGDEPTAVIADQNEDDQDSADATTSTSTTAPTTTAPDPASPPSARGGTFVDGPDAAPLALPAGSPLAGDEVAAVIEAPSDGEFGRVAVVILSLETGEVVRTLADGFDTVEGGVYRLHVTPDRRTVVYTVASSACTSLVEAVAADGSSGSVSVADRSSAVVVSPDGSRYATVSGDECVEPLVIDVASVSGGPSQRYVADPGGVVGVESIVWSGPDALTFATSTNDPSTPQSLVQIDFARMAQSILIGRTGGPWYTTLARSADGDVTALERCCGTDVPIEAAVATLDGVEVVGSRPVDVAAPATIRFAGLDADGPAIVVAGEPGTALYIDGRRLRDGVHLIAW